jgi:DNA-binding SARP family transcriptional activator
VDFQVLGPPAVVDGERQVALGTTREGALLAILLVHADETVSAARLIDELWGGNPPAGATATLQGYVRNLRRPSSPTARRARRAACW